MALIIRNFKLVQYLKIFFYACKWNNNAQDVLHYIVYILNDFKVSLI